MSGSRSRLRLKQKLNRCTTIIHHRKKRRNSQYSRAGTVCRKRSQSISNPGDAGTHRSRISAETGFHQSYEWVGTSDRFAAGRVSSVDSNVGFGPPPASCCMNQAKTGALATWWALAPVFIGITHVSVFSAWLTPSARPRCRQDGTG